MCLLFICERITDQFELRKRRPHEGYAKRNARPIGNGGVCRCRYDVVWLKSEGNYNENSKNRLGDYQSRLYQPVTTGYPAIAAGVEVKPEGLSGQ